MSPDCTIQLHVDGVWRDVATVRLSGDAAQGWRARTYSGYDIDWATDHPGARDAHALCANWPVGLQPLQLPHWPVALIDMLPQGYGRAELLKRIETGRDPGVAADWALLLHGAGNPVGHLRVKEAADWLGRRSGPLRGFTDDEVVDRGPEFAEYLASHGLFVAGSSGVQGEWPKLLLTRGRDGLLYLDHALPDPEAVEHYIVKFARGEDAALDAILRHEGPYMALAGSLGLRVHAPLSPRKRVLFIPRFDRSVRDGRVLRLAQESIATLTGMPGFEQVPSHDQVCRELLRRCTDPEAEVVEYVKRDVANIALRNTDNHARNTAVQRDFRGRIALTPLYDFAPMFLHPDGIARRIRWEGNDFAQLDWARVVDGVCELGMQVQDERRNAGVRRRIRRRAVEAVPALVRRDVLVRGLKSMVPGLRAIAAGGKDLGLDAGLHDQLRLHVQDCADQLEALA